MKNILIFFTTFILSCKGESIQSENKGDFKLELLFEKDGCKVYRFYDGGRCVYWADCRGRIHADRTTNTGKNTVTNHGETINTE